MLSSNSPLFSRGNHNGLISYRYGRDWGLAFKTEFDIKIKKKIHLKSNIETLSIRRENEFHTNYFYIFDLYYKVRKDFRLGIMVSNKTYNLDASFPTFYMMRQPMLGVHLKLDSLN